VLGDILTALTRTDVVVGALVALLVIAGLLLLNQWQDWFMSTRRHREILEVIQKEADRSHADADAKVVSMREAMKATSQELRADGAARAKQVREDSQAELNRLIQFTEAVQRDVESWRAAWNLADQANHEEDDARWDEIRAALSALARSSAVTERFMTELQRQTSTVRQLEAGSDGGGPRVG
jgi:hypothetical protein